MTDAEVLDAVAAEAGWMEDLLVRLVAAPTVLGEEEAGQAIMAAAWEDCGLAPRSVPLRAAALRDAEGASPFSWEVDGKRNVTRLTDTNGPISKRLMVRAEDIALTLAGIDGGNFPGATAVPLQWAGRLIGLHDSILGKAVVSGLLPARRAGSTSTALPPTTCGTTTACSPTAR